MNATRLLGAVLLPMMLYAALPATARAQSGGDDATEAAAAEEQVEAAREETIDCRDWRGVKRRVGDRCLPPHGARTVYSRDQLEAAGPMDAAEALRRIDPRIR